MFVLRAGEPVPLTMFEEMMESVTFAVAPAVTRMPSWPNSGPEVSCDALWHMPSAM